MGNKKEARFDIIFQGAGEGESNNISFQFLGGTLSDAVFDVTTSSVEHSSGELGGRYDYYDIENVVFYPTKERLERETRRIFGTAPDTVNFSLIEFPSKYWYVSHWSWSNIEEWRTEWYRDSNTSTLPSPDEPWKEVLGVNPSGSYRIRTWRRIEIIRNGELPNSGVAAERVSDVYSWKRKYNFDKLIATEFARGRSGVTYEPSQTLTDVLFSPSDSEEEIFYESYIPYPHEPGKHYGIERDTGTSKSIMAVWWGDSYRKLRSVALTPTFALEQPLVAMGAPYIEELVIYDGDGDTHQWKDWVSNADIWNIGFSENLPGANFKIEAFGTDVSASHHYWENCSAATTMALLNSNGDLWSGTSTALAKRSSINNTGDYFFNKYFAESLVNKTEIDFSFDSDNNDEGAYEEVNIEYMFLFRANGDVDFVSKLPNPVAVPRGCSFNLTATVDHTPEVLII